MIQTTAALWICNRHWFHPVTESPRSCSHWRLQRVTLADGWRSRVCVCDPIPQTPPPYLVKLKYQTGQRRPNSLSICLSAGTKRTFPFSMVGKSHRCQSDVLVRTAQGVLRKDGGNCLGCWTRVERGVCGNQNGNVLFATRNLRLDSSLPVIMRLHLLLSRWGGYSLLGKQLDRLSRVAVRQHKHTHPHTHASLGNLH